VITGKQHGCMIGAALLVGAGIALAGAPTSGADVCADAGGRHVSVGGCTNVAADVATGAAIANQDDAAAQAAAGQPPCYTPSGVPYYTPGSDPC
jgi:hypothetical protein